MFQRIHGHTEKKWEAFPSIQNPNVPNCFQWMNNTVKYTDFLLGFTKSSINAL